MGDIDKNYSIAQKDLTLKYIGLVTQGKDSSWNSILYSNLSSFNNNLNLFGNTSNTMNALTILVSVVLMIPTLIIILYLGLTQTLSFATTTLLLLSMIVLYITLIYVIRQILAYYFSPLYDSVDSIRKTTNLLTKLFNYPSNNPSYTF